MKSILKLPALDSRETIEQESAVVLKRRNELDKLHGDTFSRERGRPLDKEDLNFFKPKNVPLRDYIDELDEALTNGGRRR